MGVNPMRARTSKQSPTSASPIKANPAKAAPSKASGLATTAPVRPARVRPARVRPALACLVRARSGLGESDPISTAPAVKDLGAKDPAATVPAATVPASIAPLLNASADPRQTGAPAAMVDPSTARVVPARATTAPPSIGPGLAAIGPGLAAMGPGLAAMGPKACAMAIAGPGLAPGEPSVALQPVLFPPPGRRRWRAKVSKSRKASPPMPPQTSSGDAIRAWRCSKEAGPFIAVGVRRKCVSAPASCSSCAKPRLPGCWSKKSPGRGWARSAVVPSTRASCCNRPPPKPSI